MRSAKDLVLAMYYANIVNGYLWCIDKMLFTKFIRRIYGSYYRWKEDFKGNKG